MELWHDIPRFLALAIAILSFLYVGQRDKKFVVCVFSLMIDGSPDIIIPQPLPLFRLPPLFSLLPLEYCLYCMEVLLLHRESLFNLSFVLLFHNVMDVYKDYNFKQCSFLSCSVIVPVLREVIYRCVM